MQDFNDFVKNGANDKDFVNANEGLDKSGLINLVSSLAKKFDGKDQTELVKAIYAEAKKGKKNGTLTNRDIDGFANMISPYLDENKKKYLNKIVDEIKKI